MTDGSTNPTPSEQPGSAPDENFAWTGDAAGAGSSAKDTGREWLAQLQSMIENITEQAGPVLREVSAKAAELAAVAGDKAGPVAARAAELTAEAGSKLAERSRDFAADIRRDQAAKGAASEPNAGTTSDDAS